MNPLMQSLADFLQLLAYIASPWVFLLVAFNLLRLWKEGRK